MDALTPTGLGLAGEVEAERLAEELLALQALDLHELRVRWRKLMRSAPPDLPRYILLRVIAYRLQVRVHGDLDAETQRFLRRINRERLKRKEAEEAAKRKPKAPPPVPPVSGHRGLKPGTVFAREFGGSLHKVSVVKGGLSWNGEVYASLSEIARLITGTRWNGPRFFGLREREGRVP
jgi:hypothetical protein